MKQQKRVLRKALPIRRTETPNAVIRAGEAIIGFQVLMNALDAQTRLVSFFDPVAVRLTLPHRAIFPGVRVSAL